MANGRGGIRGGERQREGRGVRFEAKIGGRRKRPQRNDCRGVAAAKCHWSRYGLRSSLLLLHALIYQAENNGGSL